MSFKKLLINVSALLALSLVSIGCQKPINISENLALSQMCNTPDCMDYDKSDLQNSKEIWQKRLNEIAIGASVEDIKIWQDKYQVSLSYYNNQYSTSNLPNGYFALKNQGTACNGFFLHLTITVDEQHKVIDKKFNHWEAVCS